MASLTSQRSRGCGVSVDDSMADFEYEIECDLQGYVPGMDDLDEYESRSRWDEDEA